MKKMMSWNTTSIIGVMSIAMSVWGSCLLRFISARSWTSAANRAQAARKRSNRSSTIAPTSITERTRLLRM